MMPELSLNILDVVQNSVRAGATLASVEITADTAKDRLTVVISDDGCGMTPEQVERVTDPFFTTRTTRKVGLGIPFFKMAAEITGGAFRIDSRVGEGTVTTAEFVLSSIDRMPLGDIAGTMTALIGTSPEMDFVLSVAMDGQGFSADTREFRAVLEGISLAEPEVLAYISDYINENMSEYAPNL